MRELAAREVELATKQKTLSTTQAARMGAEQKLRVAQAQERRLQAELSTTQAQKDQAARDNTAAVQMLQHKNREVQMTKTQLQGTKSELHIAMTRLQTAQTQIQRAQMRATTAQHRADAEERAKMQAQQDRDSAARRERDARGSAEDLMRDLDEARRRERDARGSAEDFMLELSGKQAELEAVKPKPPEYWTSCTWLLQRGVPSKMQRTVDITSKVLKQEIEAMMNLNGGTCPECHRAGRRKVVSVKRLENGPLYLQYLQKVQAIRAKRRNFSGTRTTLMPINPPLPGSLVTFAQSSGLDAAEAHEVYLFHGTRWKNRDDIVSKGFDERYASDSGLYGAAIYGAQHACKSYQYSLDIDRNAAGNGLMFLCRFVLGNPYYTRESGGLTGRLPRQCDPNVIDSAIANHGEARGGAQCHREFMVYDRGQVYPEYIIEFN
jgi:hypothetical protein